MNQEKYLFVFAHDRLIAWYSVFARAWKKLDNNRKVMLFVHGNENLSYSQQYPDYDIVIDVLDGFVLQKEIQREVCSEIIDLEKKLGKSFLWDDIRTDRWLRAATDSNYKLSYINHVARVIDAEFKDKDPLVGFGESTMAAYRFAHRKFDVNNRPYLAVMSNRYTSRFRVEGTWDWSWPRAMKCYHTFVHNGIPSDLSDTVDEIYTNITIKYAKPMAFENFSKTNNKGYNDIQTFGLKIIKEKFITVLKLPNQAEFKRNLRLFIVERTFRERIIRIIKTKINHKRYTKLTIDDVPKGIKICTYFPHFQPEYTVDSWGRFYLDQSVLIHNIAAALPANYFLVVKEHPTMVGLREVNFYESILKNANTLLLNHTYDSIKLISRSNLIFSIVGSVAIEANVIGKPSIIFGRYAFDNTNLITFCDSYWKLPDLIREKLSTKLEDQVEITKHAKAILAAKIAASHDGGIPLKEEDMESFPHLEDSMVKGFLEELKLLGVS